MTQTKNAIALKDVQEILLDQPDFMRDVIVSKHLPYLFWRIGISFTRTATAVSLNVFPSQIAANAINHLLSLALPSILAAFLYPFHLNGTHLD